MRRLLVVLVTLAGPLAYAQAPSRADAFALAREATWAVAMLRLAPKGQIDQAAFVGTGFFISRTHFVTASHVVNAKLLGRSRNAGDQIRVFKNELAGDGFNQMKVVFEDADLDIAILQSAITTKNWLTVSLEAPREGDEVGLYGYPLVEFENLARASAFALGRFGMVAGFGELTVTTFGSASAHLGGLQGCCGASTLDACVQDATRPWGRDAPTCRRMRHPTEPDEPSSPSLADNGQQHSTGGVVMASEYDRSTFVEPLPARPNLEMQPKRAKDLLRGVWARHVDAMKRIRASILSVC
jgi:trypsin-like peptidase